MIKFNFAKIVCLTFLCLFFTVAYAQPYRRLTVDDFQGSPAANGGIIAYTNCSIVYSYIAKKVEDYYLLTFNIQLVVNNDKSWLDKRRVPSREMMAEILKHEQGHYNIAYIEQQELLKAVSHVVFRDDYKYVAQNIFDNIDAKYQQVNLSYDEDTQHMLNREQQHSWDIYFQKRLGTEYLAGN